MTRRTAIALLLGSTVALTACAGAGRPTLTDETLPARACSAEGMTRSLDDEGLPNAVVRTRRRIVDAATSCDYAALERLARRGELVAFIDGQDVPVDRWEQREQDGRPILRFVAGILALDRAETRSDGERQFTWPTAVDWAFSDTAPPAERQALVEVVGEDGIFGFADEGSYAGWRTSISTDGRWRSLLLGPGPG